LNDATEPNLPDATPPAAAGEQGHSAVGLSGALYLIAQRHGLGVTVSALENGLTGADGELPLKALKAAAERAGLRVDLRRANLSQVPAGVLPIIAFQPDGNAVFVEEIDFVSGRVRGRFGRDGSVADIAPEDFAARTPVILAAPARAGGADSATAGPKASSAWFWPFVMRFWPDYLQMAAAGLAINVLALALPLFTMNVYDRVVPNAATATLWALFWGMTLVLALDFLLRSLRAWIVDEVGRRVDLAVSGHLFDHLLNLSLAGKPRSAGMLASQIKEFDSVREVMTSGAVIALADAFFIVIFLGAMYLIVGPLVIIPAIAVPIVLILTLLVQIPIARTMEESQAAAAQRHGTLVEAVVGLETIKVVGAQSVMRQRWDRSVAAASKTMASARFWSNLMTNILTASQQIVTIAITVWGVYLIIDGQITMGALIAANLLSGRVLAPLAGIAQTLTRAAQARSALKGLSRFMALPSEAVPAENATSLTPRKGAVVFQNVSFHYAGAQTKALDRVSFAVKPGEKIGIVGRIGSGKTTFARLLAGLYHPTEGSILIDGIDIRQYDPVDLRKFVGVLPQDSDLFSGTLRDNIVIGRPAAGEGRLRQAVEISGVGAFASAHPQGLAMPITERGAGLSGGQRQSVSLARFLIREPRVMFLDEPTAAMDATTEAILVQRLSRIAETGVTMFISTHRDSLLRVVDRLFVLDGGKLVMDGPRDEILAALAERSKRGGGGRPQ
jgi:ATP-binding cassette subfamily C protein LapB